MVLKLDGPTPIREPAHPRRAREGPPEVSYPTYLRFYRQEKVSLQPHRHNPVGHRRQVTFRFSAKVASALVSW